MVDSAVVAGLALIGSLVGAVFAGWLAWRRAMGTEQYRALVEAYAECVGKMHDSRRANFHRGNERITKGPEAEDAARQKAYELKAGADAAIARVTLLAGDGVHKQLRVVRKRLAFLTDESITSREDLERHNRRAKRAIDKLVAQAKEDLGSRNRFAKRATTGGHRPSRDRPEKLGRRDPAMTPEAKTF